MTIVKCFKCEAPATLRMAWGDDDRQRAIACDDHAKEVWVFCASRVNAGLITWSQESIRSGAE